MTKHSLLVASWLIVAVVGVACGDDDGVDSGVDRSTPLDELTTDDVMAICDAVVDSVDFGDIQRVACYYVAILSSEDADECESIVSDCLDEPPDSTLPDDVCAVTPDELADLPPCASDVTVGQLEDCYAANADQYAELADDISCASDPDDLLDFSLPPECAAIMEICPELFEEDEQLAPARLFSAPRNRSRT